MKIEQPWNDERLKIGSAYIGCVTKENADLIMELQRDAERLRWLLETNLGVFMQVGGKVEAGQSKESIGASIDAAMRSN